MGQRKKSKMATTRDQTVLPITPVLTDEPFQCDEAFMEVINNQLQEFVLVLSEIIMHVKDEEQKEVRFCFV